MALPFTEQKVENHFIRTFSHDVKESELQWHTDQEDRLVTPLHATDWQVQLEDKLPETLQAETFIPKGVWHRVIKGSGSLTIKLVKLK